MYWVHTLLTSKHCIFQQVIAMHLCHWLYGMAPRMFNFYTVPPGPQGVCLPWTLLSTVRPQITERTADVTLEEGQGQVLKCTATGNPTPSITWKKDSVKLPPGDPSSTEHVITNAQRKDKGKYTCQASVVAGNLGPYTESYSVQVTVRCEYGEYWYVLMCFYSPFYNIIYWPGLFVMHVYLLCFSLFIWNWYNGV